MPRARDSQYARDTYKKLMPAFAHYGACADTLVAGERCDCCQRGIAKLEARITMKVENDADDQPAPEPASKGAGVRNPRPARRLLLGQMRPVRVEQNAEEAAFAAEASQAEYG